MLSAGQQEGHTIQTVTTNVSLPDEQLAYSEPVEDIELSIVMPCLNEARTVGNCIIKAQNFLKRHRIRGEIVVADNGSTDGSQRIAADGGARVIQAAAQGYGAAILAGLAKARGRFVIIGDADGSYDFFDLMPFVDLLRAETDLVVGNRFRGGIEPGAMPWIHRYFGNPALSLLGRALFSVPLGDFHCGLRGCNRLKTLSLGLSSTGMEFASDMIIKAAIAGYRVAEVPTRLYRDGRIGRSHLRTWRDGFRHLNLMLLRAPSKFRR